MRYISVVFLTIAIAISVGCSGSDSSDPVIPSDPQKSESTEVSESNRFMLGFWNISVSEDRESVEVVPLRQADNHFNVTRLLEKGCDDCLSVGNISFTPPDRLRMGITLMNPLPLGHPAFDVRGIIISDFGYHFPEADRLISWGLDVPHVLFADGYTNLFNPVEFPFDPDVPALFSYYPGELSKGNTPSATLSPYMAWFRDTERSYFPGGSDSSESLVLNLPDGAFSIGYAVDASWSPPVGDPTDLNSYLPGANCREAYRIDVEIARSLTSDPGSSGTIYVDVFDHQDLYTIQSVTMECPDLFEGTIDLDYWKMVADDVFRYTGTITNDLGAGLGDHPLLIRVVDTEQDSNLGQIDAWHVVNIPLKNGWSINWGKADARDLMLDADGNLYVVGNIGMGVDFDPDITFEEGVGWGGSDAYIAKYRPDGSLDWVGAWGGSHIDWANGVCLDSAGNVYAAGSFHYTCDFDPGPGVDERSSEGPSDCFLMKLDQSGAYQWVASWGGEGSDDCFSVAVDSNDQIYVTGDFRKKSDFMPGPDVLEINTNGGSDIFLSRFDFDGDFVWVRTWGGVADDEPRCVAVDKWNRIFVCGEFFGQVDFDPGTEVDYGHWSGDADAFLTRFGISGHHEWIATWGGTEDDRALDIAIEFSGDVLVTGNFQGSIDLDPGTGEDIHSMPFGFFLTRLDSNGEHVWSKSIEAGLSDVHEWLTRYINVTTDPSGNICLGGRYMDWIDLDPSPEADLHHAVNVLDIFLAKYSSSGEFIWGQSWGGQGIDSCHSVVCDSAGNVYSAGAVSRPIDMDPGPGIYEIDYQEGFTTHAFISMFPPDGIW